MRRGRAGVAAAAIPALALAAVACGGGGGSGSTTTTAATTPPRTTGTATGAAATNGEAALPAERILADARDAARGASSVHVAGRVPTDGQTATIDVRLVAGRGGAGNLTLGGTAVDLVQIGDDVYLKGGRGLFERSGAPSGVVQLLAGKWFKAPSSGSFASLSQLTDMRKLLDSLLKPRTGSISKAGLSRVNGTPTVVLRSDDGTLDVSLRGQPYPLLVQSRAGSGAARGRVTFSEWNQPVQLTAPANALDFSTVTG
jgi:hypothetical protein